MIKLRISVNHLPLGKFFKLIFKLEQSRTIKKASEQYKIISYWGLLELQAVALFCYFYRIPSFWTVRTSKMGSGKAIPRKSLNVEVLMEFGVQLILKDGLNLLNDCFIETEIPFILISVSFALF